MKKNIAIIGAGYTGLTAALRLAQAGHTVTIYEKGPVVGGLASEFKVEGASLERAYHHLFKTDTSIINMAKELGIHDKLLWHNSSVSLYYNGRIYPFKGALDLIRFTPLRFVNRIRAGLVVLFLQKFNKWQSLQSDTAYAWMRKYAGKQVTDVIWEPLLKGKFDTYYDKVSMAWLWARVHVRAQSREVGGEKLGYFEGGFQVFTDALVNELNTLEVSIITNADINKLSGATGSKGDASVYIGGKRKKFDRVIATVPSHVFASLTQHNIGATPAYLKKLRSIPYLGARLMIFSSNQDLSPYYWHNINDLTLPFLVFINHTKLISKKNYGGAYVYYVATYVPHDHTLFTCDDDELEKIWFPALSSVFPNFDQSKIRQKYHFRFANAQHIVDTHYASRIPSRKTPFRNIYLSNFSQIYPEDRGTNYAIRDGEHIAQLILSSF